MTGSAVPGGTGPVPPGSGWPGDPATPATPVAHDAAQVQDLAAGAGSLGELVARQSVCRACPRLVEWREQVAAVKRASSRTETYWGRPIPGWGDERPRVLIVGLAPAAHGGNRTGRIFTGDRSGDVLFASLYRCGLAVLPTSTAAGDGQRLIGARMVAAVRCAPPANKPSVTERDACAPWLTAEFARVAGSVRVIVCLGGFAWQSAWAMLRSVGFALPRPRPGFGHGAEVLLARPDGAAPDGAAPDGAAPDGAAIDGAAPVGAAADGAAPVGAAAVGAAAVGAAADGAAADGTAPDGAGPDRTDPDRGGSVLLLGCYHPSQQNTFTGRVTPAMLDAVFRRAASVAGAGGSAGTATGTEPGTATDTEPGTGRG